MRRRWLWLIPLFAAIASGVWLTHTARMHAQSDAKRDGHPQAMGAIPVAAAKAVRGDMPVYYDGLGSVTPYYTVTIHTRVDGELISVSFREGEFIQRDAVLAEIDPRPFQVQLEQAEGQLQRDEAVLRNARLDLDRYETLLAQNAIPRQQYDTQKATVAQEEGNVKTDQAAIHNARLQLTYCRVTAPIRGRIGLRLVDPGNIVHAADTIGLLVITQMQPITVIFNLPEDDLFSVLTELRKGAALPVDAFNRDKSRKLASGRLLAVDNQIDQNTGTDRLKAVFQNRESTLFPNQFVNVRILVDVLYDQVIIPSVAIQRGAQGTFAYVVRPDNTVEIRPIVVGIMEGTEASLINGLNAGDTVVTDGADKLRPGSKVVIRPQNPAPPHNGATESNGGPGRGPRP